MRFLISHRLFVIGTICAFSTGTFAQKKITHTNQQWLQAYGQWKINEKLNLSADAGVRRMDGLSEWSQMLVRAGIGYKLIGNLQGTTGVACFTFFAEDKIARIEYRPYQELLTTQTFGKATVQHRFRLESRYFRRVDDGLITSDDQFNFRFRHRVYITVPIWQFSEKNPDRKLLFNIGDEIFLNAGNEVVYNAMDNNRLVAGLSLSLNAKTVVSCIYNLQTGQRMRPASYEYTDVVWLTINHRGVLRKEETKKG